MDHRYFFGYGSLVNRATHDYTGAFPARLIGWRRAWRRSPSRALCYLTIVEATGQELLGLVAPVPKSQQDKLAQREHAYGRRRVTHAVDHAAPHIPEVETHVIPEGKHLDPTKENPILLSYLDVVVQGYLAEFGRDGAQHFFDTTDGWNASILDDRARPFYPRAQPVQFHEARLVDAALSDFDANIIPLTNSSWEKYLGGPGAAPPVGRPEQSDGRNL